MDTALPLSLTTIPELGLAITFAHGAGVFCRALG